MNNHEKHLESIKKNKLKETERDIENIDVFLSKINKSINKEQYINRGYLELYIYFNNRKFEKIFLEELKNRYPEYYIYTETNFGGKYVYVNWKHKKNAFWNVMFFIYNLIS